MFDKQQIEKLVQLQNLTYQLLQWVGNAIEEGFISFGSAHTNVSTRLAAEEWLTKNYQNIPLRARPEEVDIPMFCGLFSSYLENSFELVEKPEQRLYSDDAHCFCPMCSWLVNVSHLKTKLPANSDKRRAKKLMQAEIERLMVENEIYPDAKKVERLLEDNSLKETLALCAYGTDLKHRVNGAMIGPAALVLWRAFAWTPTGAPKKNFKLTASMIIEAEKALFEAIKKITH